MKTITTLFASALLLSACSNHSANVSNADNEALSYNAAEDGAQPRVELGRISIAKRSDNGGELLFNGRPLKPAITGNDTLAIVHTYNYPDKALYVVQDTGGTACPAQFDVVEVRPTGVIATDAFGTCSDVVKVAEVPGGLTLSMSGFVGPMSDDADEAAANATHVFTYRNRRVSERTTQASSGTKITSRWLVGYWVSAPQPTRELECGTDTGVQFNRDGTFFDGGHKGRFRTDGRSVTYFDRIMIDESGEIQGREDYYTPETNAIRADGPNAFVEAGERLQRCQNN